MSRIIYKSVLLAAFALFFNFAAKAQPSWSVNPNNFVYSMTITGKINTDGYLSDDINDKIAAFIDGECRGVVNVKKTQLNDYFVFLMVYSNSPTGTVTFKIYDASENKEFTVKQTINFTVNDIIGSVSNPFIFSASALSNEAKILSFAVPDQQGQTFFNGNRISLQTIWSGDLTNIAPVFTASEGAKITVNGVEQVSGITVNNFSQPLEYVVESADLSQTTSYTVSVTLANDIPTDLQLSNTEVEENVAGGVIGTLKAFSENQAKPYYYSLLPIPGTDNSNFYVEGDKLKYYNPLNFEVANAHKVYVQADDKKGGIIKRYFIIGVIDKNDAPGTPGIKNVSLPETMPANHVAGELYAIDEDSGDSQTFTLVTGNGTNDRDNALFHIDGKWLKTKASLTYIKGTEFNVLVKVTDSKSASSTAWIVFGVADQGVAPFNIILSNDVVPDISNPPVFVGKLHAMDADQSAGHIFAFKADTLAGADNQYFSLKGDSLFLANPLPENEKTNYSIAVSVTDSTNRQFTKAFVIKVTKGEIPDGFYLTKSTIPENTAFNSIVGFFDSQTYQANNYSFSLPLEVDLNKFANNDFKLIGRTLLTNRIFDFEETKSATIQVEVSNGLSSTIQNVTVQITDENDAPSGISLSNVIFSESAVLNTPLGVFSAFDQDAGDTHQYSLVLGNGINDESNTFFRIDGTQLLLAKPLDYESKEFHNILVRVVDNKGASFEQGLRLQVADANDAPFFTSTPAGYVLQDEVYVYAIKVSDSEGDSVQFQFDGLPEWLHFSPGSAIISGTPGNEMVGDYSFTIRISDGNKERTQPVILSVINVNDAPELNYYLEKQTFFSGVENLVTIPADLITDPDIDDVLKFTLSTENNAAIPAWLQFDSKTMLLSGNPPADAEGIYALKLTATDKAKLKEWMVFQLEVAMPTASDDLSNESVFSVFPNPVTDQLNYRIPMNDAVAGIEITDVAGKWIESLKCEPGSLGVISFLGKAPGIYYLKFTQGDIYQTKKVVKQ